MEYGFQTARFEYQYKEDRTENILLWENHCHARFEMIAVLEGDVSIMPEGRNYRLTANQTAIIPPLVYHTVEANKKCFYRRVTVLFDISAIPAPLRDKFADKAMSPIIIPSHDVEELKNICCSENYEFYSPLADSIMTRTLYEYIKSGHESLVTPIDETLKNLLDYIDNNLCNKITLDDLSSHAARSKSSVCHMFSEKMKIPPKQYIIKKRLALANRLIKDGIPPTEAAMRIGYDNYSDFYRLYKKLYQETPRST